MSHIKHPIVGDPFYGGRHISMRHITGRPTDSDELIWNRQMLHACRLIVQHPIEERPLVLEAPYADDMQGLLDTLRQFAVRKAPARKGRR
jgi:23S rRNA pseudouridine1911/1915/1917 synthase